MAAVLRVVYARGPEQPVQMPVTEESQMPHAHQTVFVLSMAPIVLTSATEGTALHSAPLKIIVYGRAQTVPAHTDVQTETMATAQVMVSAFGPAPPALILVIEDLLTILAPLTVDVSLRMECVWKSAAEDLIRLFV